MEIGKSKVLIQFHLIFRQSGDVLFFLYAHRLRGYTATDADSKREFSAEKLISMVIWGAHFVTPKSYDDRIFKQDLYVNYT